VTVPSLARAAYKKPTEAPIPPTAHRRCVTIGNISGVSAGNGRPVLRPAPTKLRALEDRDDDAPRDAFGTAGFIAAWRVEDDGNVAPRMIVRGPAVGAGGFAGVAFDAKRGELYGVSGELNGYVAWIVPEFFRKPKVGSNAAQQ
jgi:hypothetical protein